MKEFLESYPLYKKFNPNWCGEQYDHSRKTVGGLPKPAINMFCGKCDSIQTFNCSNEYYEHQLFAAYPNLSDAFEKFSFDQLEKAMKDQYVRERTVKVDYLCSGCKKNYRYFMLNFFYSKDKDDNCLYVRKVGQFPAWSIDMDKNLEQELGSHSTLYKRGLENESQGYGIGAFAYFRRITETVIDDLLDSVSDLLEGEEKTKYEKALVQTKETRVTQEKIDLVKDLLPASLRPNGMNPLGVLHSALSEGLHAETDEECLEYADEVKQTLVYLINQIERSRSASKTFTEGMRKILEKRTTKQQAEGVEDKK